MVSEPRVSKMERSGSRHGGRELCHARCNRHDKYAWDEPSEDHPDMTAYKSVSRVTTTVLNLADQIRVGKSKSKLQRR